MKRYTSVVKWNTTRITEGGEYLVFLGNDTYSTIFILNTCYSRTYGNDSYGIRIHIDSVRLWTKFTKRTDVVEDEV